MTSLYRIPAAARGARRPQQHAVDRTLSQRRPAGGHVRDRAADRHGRAGVRLRPRRTAPPQSDHARLPYSNAFGVTYDSGDYAGSLDDVLTLADWDGFAARPESSGPRPAARHRPRRLRRIAKRRAAGARRGHGAARRRRRGRDRHPVGGPGPCDQLRPAHRRMAWRSDRQGAYRQPAIPIASRSAAAALGPLDAAAATTIHKAALGIIAKGRKLAAQQLEAAKPTSPSSTGASS